MYSGPSAKIGYSKTEWLVATSTGLFIFLLSPQQFIFERFSLFERSAVALSILLIVSIFISQRPSFFVLPTAQILLLFVIALSLTHAFRFAYLKDVLAFAMILLYGVLAQYFGGARSAILGGAIAALLLTLVTVIAVVWAPDFAYESSVFIRGTFAGKNSLAISLLATSPAILFVTLRRRTTTYILRACMLSCLGILIYLSGSRTTLIVFLVMVTMWIVLTLYELGMKKTATTAVVFLGGSTLWSVANWNAFTSFFGKQSDLTGRIPLWDIYWTLIQRRPLQGYGWQVDTLPDTELGVLVATAYGHAIPNANNEFLNIWALVGISGPILDLLIIGVLIVGGLLIKHEGFAIAGWTFLTGSVMLFLGIAEVSTMHPESWLVVALASTALGDTILTCTPSEVRLLKRIPFFIKISSPGGKKNLSSLTHDNSVP